MVIKKTNLEYALYNVSVILRFLDWWKNESKSIDTIMLPTYDKTFINYVLDRKITSSSIKC